MTLDVKGEPLGNTAATLVTVTVLEVLVTLTAALPPLVFKTKVLGATLRVASSRTVIFRALAVLGLEQRNGSGA